LVPALSFSDNVFLGIEETAAVVLRCTVGRPAFPRASTSLRLRLDPAVEYDRSLRIARRQELVESCCAIVAPTRGVIISGH